VVTVHVMHSSHLLYVHTSSASVYETAYLYMTLFVDDINVLGGRVGTVKRNTTVQPKPSYYTKRSLVTPSDQSCKNDVTHSA